MHPPPSGTLRGAAVVGTSSTHLVHTFVDVFAAEYHPRGTGFSSSHTNMCLFSAPGPRKREIKPEEVLMAAKLKDDCCTLHLGSSGAAHTPHPFGIVPLHCTFVGVVPSTQDHWTLEQDAAVADD